MKLKELLHEQYIRSIDVDKLVAGIIARRYPENYPKNSISIRESIGKIDVNDLKRAEELCSALNNEVTKCILNFNKKVNYK